MKITVRDCLELDAFKPSIVAAGKRNLNNTVSSISVMDTADLKSAVAENGIREQMVLTTFSSMKGDYDLQSKVVKELALSGVAAIVVFKNKKELKGI